jgi:hypothetical protein
MNRWLGIPLVLTVCLLWVTSSLVMRMLFLDWDFDRPLLVTLLNTSLFAVYWLPWLWLWLWRGVVTGARSEVQYGRGDGDEEEDFSRAEGHVDDGDDEAGPSGQESHVRSWISTKYVPLTVRYR